MTQPAAGRSELSLGRKLLFSGVMMVSLLVIAEGAWRVYLYRTGRGFFDDPHEFISPFFTTFDEPMPVITRQAFYYRNGSVSRDKPADEIRVICFGGSTTVNFRAGGSYPERIEARLTADGLGPVRVLNAGGEGYSTAHILVNLALRNLAAKPDVITVYENINDLSAIYFGDGVEPDYANKYETDFYLGLRHRSGVLAEISRVSRLFRVTVFSINALRFPEVESNRVTDWSAGIEIFRNNLRSILAIAQTHGIRVVIATQPARSDHRHDPGFAAYNDAIRAIAEQEKVPLIDIHANLTNDEFFLPDAIHNNKEGVAALAELWYPALRDVVADERARRNAGGS